MLSGVELVGFFTDQSRPGAAPKEDRYTIKKVQKLRSGNWRFTAAFEYGGQELSIPIVLPVEWAGGHAGDRRRRLDLPGHGHLLGSRALPRQPVRGRVERRRERRPDVRASRAAGGGEWRRRRRGRRRAGPDGPRRRHLQPGVGDGQLALLPGHPRPRRVRGLPHRDDLGRRERREHPVEGGDPRPRPLVPGDLGQPHLPDHLGARRRRVRGSPTSRSACTATSSPRRTRAPQRFQVLCIDKRKGEILWTRTAFEGEPRFARHPKGSFAASTAATDGEHVVAFFGTEGLYCYDMEGELLWQKDLGDLDHGFYMVPAGPVGLLELPDPPPRTRAGAVRRAGPVLPGLLRGGHRRGGLGHRARRGADLRQPDGRDARRPQPGDRERLQAHRRLRPGDGRRALEARRRRRHPGPDPGGVRRADLRHQRPRPAGSHLRHLGRRRGRDPGQGRGRGAHGLEHDAPRQLHADADGLRGADLLL